MLALGYALYILFAVSFFLIIRSEFYSISQRDEMWYRHCRKHVIKSRWLPSGWVFSIWLILYIIATVGITIIFIDLYSDTNDLDTLSASDKRNRDMKISILSLFWAAIIVNKYWSMLFFRNKSFVAAIVTIILQIVLFIPIIVMSFILEFYWSAAFFCIFTLWLCFAVYLNSVFIHQSRDVKAAWNELLKKNELWIHDKK